MHCVHSIQHEQEEKFYRLFILSFIVFIATLSVAIIWHHLSLGNNYTYQYPLVGFSYLLLLYPFHKMCHFIVLPHKKDSFIRIKRYFVIVPFFEVKCDTPVKKNYYLLSLITPFIVITLIWLFVYFQYDLKSVYWYLLLAIHMAICTTDIYYFFSYLKFPKNSFIEDSERGIKVLVEDNFEKIHS